jgi:hypothetical protein
VHALGGSGVFRKLPVRAHRAPHQFAAAIGAGALQFLGAVVAKGAFEAADVGVRGCRRKVDIAAFATRPELEHGIPLPTEAHAVRWTMRLPQILAWRGFAVSLHAAR